MLCLYLLLSIFAQRLIELYEILFRTCSTTLFSFYKTYSQDTLKIGPSYNYSSNTNPHRGKEFASRLEYGIIYHFKRRKG